MKLHTGFTHVPPSLHTHNMSSTPSLLDTVMTDQISARQAQFNADIEAAATLTSMNTSSSSDVVMATTPPEVGLSNRPPTAPSSPVIPLCLPPRSNGGGISVTLPGIEVIDTIRLLTDYANSLHEKIKSMREKYFQRLMTTGEHRMMPPEFDEICSKESTVYEQIRVLQSYL